MIYYILSAMMIALRWSICWRSCVEIPKDFPKHAAHHSRNCLINFRRTNGVNGQSALAFGPFRAGELWHVQDWADNHRIWRFTVCRLPAHRHTRTHLFMIRYATTRMMIIFASRVVLDGFGLRLFRMHTPTEDRKAMVQKLTDQCNSYTSWM